MKTTLQKFFKSKKNKIIVYSLLALTILASAGIYANSKKQEQARIEKLKAEEEAKKQQEEKQKIEIAKAEEKKKAEELEKEKLKAEEEKAKVEQQKAEVDKKEKDNFVENKSNSAKKETQKNSNSTSRNSENSKKNKKKDNNNNNNNNGNKFEVEEDENTYSKIGNTGKFFSTRAEATAWAKSQVANENSDYWKNGYKSWWVGQCKHNGKIGWTVSFIK